jgi:hypothetical protein
LAQEDSDFAQHQQLPYRAKLGTQSGDSYSYEFVTEKTPVKTVLRGTAVALGGYGYAVGDGGVFLMREKHSGWHRVEQGLIIHGAVRSMKIQVFQNY